MKHINADLPFDILELEAKTPNVTDFIKGEIKTDLKIQNVNNLVKKKAY